jgi:acyl-CoA synthetase
VTNTLLTLHDPEMARRYYAEGQWRRDTLYTLLCDHAMRRPAAFAVRDGQRRLSWSELRALVDAVAADLHAAGLKRGERVSVWLPNRVEAVAILLACSPARARDMSATRLCTAITRSARSSNC